MYYLIQPYLFYTIMESNSKLYKEQLYSRQIGTLGESCMKQLSNLHVLIIQLDTIGFEAAKCLVLTGIHTLYISDPRIPTASHIGLNIAIQKNHTQSIAQQTKTYLDTLNPFVTIVVVEECRLIVQNYPIDVCIQTNVDQALERSSFCHTHDIVYILGYQYNLLGYIFNDFGHHVIHNQNGEKAISSYVTNITKDKNCITLELDTPHMDSTSIQFIQPCIKKIYTVRRDPHKHSIIYLEYDESIEPISLTTAPNILIQESKPSSIIRHTTLHEHLAQKKYIPDVIGHSSSVYNSTECVELFHTYIQHSSPDPAHRKFPIIGSIIGAIIAQEVIKTTGIYTPIHQQYIIDYSDIPTQKITTISKVYSLDDPYYHIRSILPEYVLHTLNNLRIFLVGCGALGCEYLKYFHQLHMASTDHSLITVTDMDHIELSNLNRQFLFRENNIGKSKSLVAAQSIQDIHSNTHTPIHICALDKELSTTSNDYFNYTFWESNDIIVNALDNIITRQFVDEKCVLHTKPLFESGTLGTKCNVQVIIPHKTITYSETQDPPQKEIPVCTIKHFPYTIDHCISWALDIFHYHFTISMGTVQKVCNTDNFIASFDHVSNINNKYDLLVHTTYLFHCIRSRKRAQHTIMIKYLVLLLHTYYCKDVEALQRKHPKDSLQEDGTPFWSGHKLYPTILDVSSRKQFIYTWVETMYTLYVQSIPCLEHITFTEKIHKSIDNYLHTLHSTDLTIEKVLYTYIRSYYSQHAPDTYTPIDISAPVDVKIDMLYSYIHTIKHKPKQRKYKKHVQPSIVIHLQSFDKDHLTNKHIDMISYMSNYRAAIYSIQPISIPECRMIAGNIIPALSTTTTLVTGLSIMEMLKYICNTYCVSDGSRDEPMSITHMDHFVNMGVNTHIQSEPMKQKMVRSGFNSRYGCEVITKPGDFSVWDKIMIHTERDTVHSIYDVIQLLKHTYNINVAMLSIVHTVVYTNDMDIELCKHMSLDAYPKHEYIQLDSTDFEGQSLVVYPNIVLYCE